MSLERDHNIEARIAKSGKYEEDSEKAINDGDYDQAITYINKALFEEPYRKNLIEKVAWIHFLSGNEEQMKKPLIDLKKANINTKKYQLLNNFLEASEAIKSVKHKRQNAKKLTKQDLNNLNSAENFLKTNLTEHPHIYPKLGEIYYLTCPQQSEKWHSKFEKGFFNYIRFGYLENAYQIIVSMLEKKSFAMVCQFYLIIIEKFLDEIEYLQREYDAVITGYDYIEGNETDEQNKIKADNVGNKYKKICEGFLEKTEELFNISTDLYKTNEDLFLNWLLTKLESYKKEIKILKKGGLFEDISFIDQKIQEDNLELDIIIKSVNQSIIKNKKKGNNRKRKEKH